MKVLLRNMSLVLFLCAFLLTGCKAYVRLNIQQDEKKNIQFNIRGVHVRLIYRVSLWTNPDCDFLWIVRSESRTQDSRKVFLFGEVPDGMFQIFPKQEKPPSHPQEGKIIIVSIDFQYDGLVPSASSMVHAYEVMPGGEWRRIEDHMILRPPLLEPRD